MVKEIQLRVKLSEEKQENILLKKAAGIQKGSGTPNSVKVGKVTRAQLEEIATTKMKDLNANDMDAAVNIIAGSARSMGLDVEG